jgi:hypothetical protein
MFGATDESGWVFGTVGGKSGWFPRELVEEVPLEGAKPLFKVVPPLLFAWRNARADLFCVSQKDATTAMDKTALKKEAVLPVGTSARPSFGDAGPAVDMKEKKLTLGLLFKKPSKGAAAAAPVEVALSEEQVDALVLRLADEEGGPGWAKGKKLLTLKSFDNVCQGSVLCKWLLDKEYAKEEKDAVVLLEYLLAHGVLRDPAKNKKAFERGTMYQLCLLLTPQEVALCVCCHFLSLSLSLSVRFVGGYLSCVHVQGQVTALNVAKLWAAGPPQDAAELAADIARKTEKFFKPSPQGTRPLSFLHTPPSSSLTLTLIFLPDVQSVSSDTHFRALVLEMAALQSVDPCKLLVGLGRVLLLVG